MAHARKTEIRLLTPDEMAFVEKARHPALGMLPAGDLAALVHYLRERRARALAIANDQRRALRGKGGRPTRTNFAAADLGNRQKASVLNDALMRAQREVRRRAAEQEAEAGAA